MNTPTTNDVVLQLAQLGRDLDAKQREIRNLDEAAVRARARYEVTLSRNFLKAEGAMDVRKHTAIVESADLKLDAEIADQVLRAARESIRVLRDRLDIGRSLNSAIKSEWSAQGAGQQMVA
jgi:hypothetical protein